MSIWGDEDEDAGLDPWGGALTGADEPETDEEHDADFDTALGDGFPDPTMTVRIWLDASRRVAKVHVSNKWRKRAAGTSLSALFDDAFALANAHLAPVPAPAYAMVTAPGPLTWGVVEALADAANENARQARAVVEAGEDAEPSRLTPEETVGRNTHQTVTVTIGPQAQTLSVEFDENWLAGVRVDELVAAVEEAHADAYRRHTPPDVVPGALARLVDANTALALEVDAYLRRPVSLEENR